MAENPTVKFYRAIDYARTPVRADRSAMGTLPAAAYRHCHAVTTASSMGWYIFSPLDFTVQWDGAEVLWTYDGADSWYPLQSAQYPGFPENFDMSAPEALRGFSPPFLTSTVQPGLLQIWSGLFARTTPGWSLLIRPIVNYPVNRNFRLYEGVVGTDGWFGPLFSHIQLEQRDRPIGFGTEIPLFRVQALPRIVHSDSLHKSLSMVESLDEFSPEDWLDYEKFIVEPNKLPNRPVGAYSAQARRRDKE